MPDDLTAMLERGLRDYKAIDSTDPSGVSHLGLDDADYLALAARLAEVAEKWHAAREAEAAELLREVVDSGNPFDSPWCDAAWDKARAYLASRKEHPMPDQPHCRWCGHRADRPIHGPGWRCHHCLRTQDVTDCPCCGGTVSVERVEAYLGHPVGKAQEVIDGWEG